MKYAVSQYGARAHYAVPRILQKHGALERLFTDICAVKGWPTLLHLIPQKMRSAGVRRLCTRIPHDIPRQKITAFTNMGWRINKQWARAKTAEEGTAAYLRMGRELSELVIRHGLGDAKGVYAFNGEALELLRHARQRGIRTVLEQTIAPKELEVELLTKEAELHPQWGPAPENNRLLPEFIERQHAEWRESDLVVCGSQYVADGIRGCTQEKVDIEVIPYGVDATFSVGERERRRGPLRVLTVGTLNVRKGIPYVCEAARLLYGKAEFRMIGSIKIPPAVLEDVTQYAEVISRVPREEIVGHYAWADVFLLPSLCEGSAVASYEALAAGLPVIATANTGTVVRDGMEGFIVPIQDAQAIAERIEQLARDRELLRAMSVGARKRADSFTLDEYAKRLISVLLA